MKAMPLKQRPPLRTRSREQIKDPYLDLAQFEGDELPSRTQETPELREGLLLSRVGEMLQDSH
jgi:hypothetical protein